jgi:gliding motility-associated-like protein
MITVDVYLDQSLQIPDFFTPNGDGYNDTWVITGLYHYPGVTVEVFDRYGKKLYQSAGAQFSWNGIYAGLDLPSDTYWYVITLTEGLEPLTGSVTIKR